MASVHQDSFDFQGSIPSVLPVMPLRTVADNNALLQELNAKLIGDSTVMHNLKRSIQAVSASAETVLITGESGTGKELISCAIHDCSTRRQKPFLPVNCGALTESLLESELFGHVKGAFTGATTSKKGFFEAANGGTIFLDEFAEMSLATQQRLLRVLQERTVRPVGSTDPREIEIDTRVVVATNRDLKRDISEGKFRHDLYYRVNVLQIHSPALRDRREDIFALAQHFIRKYNDKNSAKVSERISSEVVYHVNKVKTPVLLEAGANSLVDQWRMLYQGLQRHKVTSQLVIYPRTAHGIQEPKLLFDSYRRNMEWFDHWVLGKVADETVK